VRLIDDLVAGGAVTDVGQLSDGLARIAPADLQRAFAVCRSTTVLSLIGDEAAVRQAL
jgi:hypothetical protein